MFIAIKCIFGQFTTKQSSNKIFLPGGAVFGEKSVNCEVVASRVAINKHKISISLNHCFKILYM